MLFQEDRVFISVMVPQPHGQGCVLGCAVAVRDLRGIYQRYFPPVLLRGCVPLHCHSRKHPSRAAVPLNMPQIRSLNQAMALASLQTKFGQFARQLASLHPSVAAGKEVYGGPNSSNDTSEELFRLGAIRDVEHDRLLQLRGVRGGAATDWCCHWV